MKRLGFFAALLVLVAFSSTAISVGLAITPLISPVWNAAAHLWPPFAVRGSWWIRFSVGGFINLAPSLLLYFMLRIEAIADRLARWSWWARLTYQWLSAAIFVSAARFALDQLTGKISLVIFTFSAWALPVCLVYEAFSQQEQERRLRLAWGSGEADRSMPEKFWAGFRMALSLILGFIFTRNKASDIDGDVLGKSAAVKASDL